MSGARPGHAAGTDGPIRALSVSADLELLVDGRPAKLEGAGQHLVLTSEDPVHLWSTLSDAWLPSRAGEVSGPRAVGRAASALRDVGVTIDVAGPGGTVVRLGAGAHSRTGRLITGSPAVQPYSVRAVLPFGVRLGSRVADGVSGWLGVQLKQRFSGTARPDGASGTPPQHTASVAAGAGLVALVVVTIRRLRRS
jgi:hypothetical protein